MEGEADLREFEHLWDGSENWALIASYWTSELLNIVFAGASPSVEELAALRRLCEEFRVLPVRELKALLHDKTEVELGHFPGMESHELQERAAQLQVPFQIRSHLVKKVSYLPVQYIEGEEFALIIENDELRNRVIRQMLMRGVPVIPDLRLYEE